MKKNSENAGPKKRKTPKTVKEYIASLPRPARSVFGELHSAIHSAVPAKAQEIISYGIPAYKDQQVIVWFAAFSKHYSLFPTAAVLDQFKEELKPYPVSKGTVRFPVEKPLPLALIRKLVKARVAQIKREKAAAG